VLPLRKIEGKYEVVRKLSEGGMGVLYLVRHRQLEELRVIKVLRASLDAEPDLRDRFLREAKSAIRLRHPNIAQLYDFSVDEDGAAYMVMEYIDGVNLEELCRAETIPEVPMAVEIALQALRALRFLHAKGYIHRDIAPDNLMLTRDAEGQLLVKLIDLGIVKILRDETQKSVAGIYLGKPRYSSPEQLMGKELDGRSDLYSFGILMFELLTGRYPILGQDFASLVTGHLYRPPLAFDEADPGRRVPPALRRLIEKSLEKAPADRLSGTEELARLLAGLPIARWEDPEGARLGALLSRHRAAAAGAPAAARGTTQEELDRHFDRARATPSPATIEELASRVAPPPAAAPRSSLSLTGIEVALSTGDLAEATRLLAAASDDELSLPAVRALREQIEHRMAEREAAQRGVREPDAEALAWADSQLKKLVAPEGPARPHPTRRAPAVAVTIEAEEVTAEASTRGSLDAHARQALEGGIGEAERLLRLGDTETAAELLESLGARTPVWEMPAGLQVRFRALEDEARSLRLAARLARAERALADGASVDAEYELEAARSLDRSHPAVAALAERVRLARQDTQTAFRPPPGPVARPPWLLPVLIAAGALLLVLLVALLTRGG
jgi:tRNA A-37 threonylcarbamoyl transferase component Bud32